MHSTMPSALPPITAVPLPNITAGSRQRNAAIDILKTVAIIGVLFIHTGASALAVYPIGSFPWMSAVFWGSLIRFSVPVFFMCSGALLLDPQKEIPLKKLYAKYLLRIAAALFFWAAAYEVYNVLRQTIASGGFDSALLIDAVKNLVLFKHHFHLYYLQIIILFYALLPITRVFMKHATKTELRYALALWLVFGILYPSVKRYYPFTLIGGIPLQYAENMTYASVGYGVLGFYIKKYGAGVEAYKWFVLYAAGLIFTFGGMVALSLHGQNTDTTLWEGMSPAVACMAAGIFGFVTSSCRNRTEIKAVVRISKASFCIYLVHDFFNMMFKDYHLTTASFQPIVFIPVFSAAVFALSYAVYLIISRIPIAKKWII